MLGLMLAAILPGAVALADGRPASIVGRWQLNNSESEFLPNETPPSELVMAITQDDGNKFRWTVTVKMPDGASGATHFDGAIDGKPYPVDGRPGNTSVFSWTAEGSLKQVSQSKAGIAVEICSFSGSQGAAPPRRMTCNTRQTDSAGRAASYLEVFDRL
jgi:hypothetical protein